MKFGSLIQGAVFAVSSVFLTAANAAIMTKGAVTDLGGEYVISNLGGRGSDLSLDAFSVESMLGMASGELSTFRGTAYEGSFISGSYAINAGDTFSFDWDWDADSELAYALRLADPYSSPFMDFAFLQLEVDGTLVDGGVKELAYALSAYDANPSDPFAAYAGTYSWVADRSGVLNFGVGVMDVASGPLSLYGFMGDSLLTVSNIDVSALPVPEPGMLALVLVGFAGLGYSRRRQA